MDGMKTYYVQSGIGKSKHVVNFHDGIKKHADGSNFYDIAIFNSKKSVKFFTSGLEQEGYKPEH